MGSLFPTTGSDILQLFLALAVGGLILSIVVLVVAPARGSDTCTVDDLDALDDAGPAWPAEPGPKMPRETSTNAGAANIIAVLGAVATAAFTTAIDQQSCLTGKRKLSVSRSILSRL